MNIGDVVDVTGRQVSRGTVKGFRSEGKAIIHFKIPKSPKVKGACDDCGSMGLLSLNRGTGEIECMLTDCGYGHGFEEHD